MKTFRFPAPFPACRQRVFASRAAFILLALASVFGVPARAQRDPDLDRLSLRQAEALFVTRNRDVLIAERAVEAAAADRITAGQRPNPVFSYNASSINPRAGLRSGPPWDKSIDHVLGLSRLFERGRKRELRMELAQFNIQARRGDLESVTRQQRIAVTGGYYDLLLAQEKERISADTVGLLDQLLRAADLRLRAGDIAPSEVSRIRVDSLRAQNEARQAVAETQKAQLNLGYLIGLEARAGELRATDPWPAPDGSLGSLAIDDVLARRADVQAAQALVRAAEKNRELARALRYRDVTLGASYERFPPDNSSSFGVGVSVPLFTSYYFEGEIRRAEVDLATAQDVLERVRAQALAEIRRARADLEAARDKVERFDNVLLKEAQRAADAAEFAYRNGALGVTDLLDARRVLFATRVDGATARADYAKSLAIWEAAITGVILSE